MPAGYPNPPKHLTDVKDGDLWQVGNHLFTCGDGGDGTHLRALIEGRDFDLMYVDPPWNDNDVTFWRNRSKRAATAETRAVPLATALITPARDRRVLAYCEVGLPNFRNFIRMFGDMGADVTGTWMTPTTVNTKRTCAVVAADFRPGLRSPDHANLDGIDDGQAPRLVMEHIAPEGGKTVLDPCCGLGFTSRGAEANGWSSLNHELNPDRLARTMEAMEDITGTTASLLNRIH